MRDDAFTDEAGYLFGVEQGDEVGFQTSEMELPAPAYVERVLEDGYDYLLVVEPGEERAYAECRSRKDAAMGKRDTYADGTFRWEIHVDGTAIV